MAGPGAYDVAFLIFMLPHSLVTVSLATALFTRLSGQAHDADVAGVRATLSSGLRVVGVFTVFATAAIVVLALPLTRVVLATASAGSADAVAAVVLAMILGLPAFGAWSMFQRVVLRVRGRPVDGADPGRDGRGRRRRRLGVAAAPAGRRSGSPAPGSP